MAQRTAKQRRAANARQAKVAQLAAAERRQRARRMTTFGAIGVVIVVILVMVGVKLGTGGDSGRNGVSSTASTKVVSAVTSVPASVYAQVGNGGIKAAPRAINGQPVTADGKPKVLYVGAEFCPYCAAERWVVASALARFGNWSGIGETSSTSHDYAPDTPTLTFHGASYSSDYVSFTGYETADRDGQPLDSMSSTDQKLFAKYDFPPYVSAAAENHIPLLLLGGKYMLNGASYGPEILHGMTHAEVAKAMHDPSSEVAKAIDGSANEVTAAICKLTGNKPASVCSAPGVQAGASKLKPAS